MIVVIGSMNLDRIARLGRAPAAGETVAIDTIDLAPGGKGGNVAAAAARVGARVRMVARVGDDADGALLRDALAGAGVDVAGVQATAERATGGAWIWVERGGENRIGVFAGANATLTPAALDRILDDGGAPLPAGAAVVLNLEIPADTVGRAIARAHAAQGRVFLNPSPIGAVGPDALGPADVLVLNGPEAAQLLAGPEPRDLGAAAVAAARLRERGPGTVVVTLGGAGAAAADGTERLEAPGVPVEAVDTTGCGDAFLGCLCAAIDGGLDLAAALSLATAAGAFTATRPGAQSAQPSAAELAAFGRAHALSLPALARARGHSGSGGGEAPGHAG